MKRLILALATLVVLSGSGLALVRHTSAQTNAPSAECGSCNPRECGPCTGCSCG